jgi:sugar phosphate isomerase/epimerase
MGYTGLETLAVFKPQFAKLSPELVRSSDEDGSAQRLLRHIRELAEEANIQICLELQNCWYERDLPRLFREHVSHIGIVQVSDFRVGEELRLNRRVPGDGSMPLAWMIGQLLEAGYRGLFDIEILGPSIEAEGPEEALRRSVEWLSDLLKEYGA